MLWRRNEASDPPHCAAMRQQVAGQPVMVVGRAGVVRDVNYCPEPF